MKLNNQLPGLPEWPPIVQDSDAYVVGGPHVSYRRFMMSGWVGILFMLAYLVVDLLIVIVIHPQSPLMLFIGLLVPLVIFVAAFPSQRLLCEWFYPRKTLVRFTPQHIIIGDQRYDNAPSVSVQFRANRPHLTEDHYNNFVEFRNKGRLTDGMAYQMKFRKIEMIYGSRIIHITSLADEDRAAQFAIALQLGHELAAQQKAAPAQRMSARTVTAKDDLPE
jgi:hypothetical protein